VLALLDLEFKDDLSCYRAGHGAKNIAVVTVNLDSVPCMSAFDNLAVGLTIVLLCIWAFVRQVGVNSPLSLPDLDWGDRESAGVCHSPSQLNAEGMAGLDSALRMGIWMTARA